MTRLRPMVVLAGLLMVAAILRGCGLGMVEIDPNSQLSFRIENGAAGSMRVSIDVQRPDDDAIDGASAASAGKGRGATTADQSITLQSDQAEVLVPAGGVTTGVLTCGDLISLIATDGANGTTVAQLTGAGTGTPGFDSGSTSSSGERFLIRGDDYACGDSIVLQLPGAQSGRLFVVPPGGTMPTTIIGDGADSGDDPGADEPTGAGGTVTFRLENATPTAADFTIDTTDTGDGAEESQVIDVRVPPGAFTSGDVDCGDSFVVSSAMVDGGDSSVLYEGDGTGTPGFDGESIGFNGERLLLFGDHFKCGDSVVVRVTDDGSGIGPSSSDEPRGQVTVFNSGAALPDPDLPDTDQLEGGDEPVEDGDDESITFVIVNQTGSTIQGNFAAGNGSLAKSGGTDVSDEFDVRVPPFSTSRGIKRCAQEYVLAMAHLEATGTTFSQGGGGSIFSGGGNVNFHGVVLTGDGTGTDGFDNNSIAVERGRLFQLGTHFECGDTITVTVTATNNQLKFDEEGEVITDEAGNPEILYGVGSGSAQVTAGG